MRASARLSCCSFLAAIATAACGDSSGPDLDAPFTAISAGLIHSCGVTSSGSAFCWGWNERGQLGDGSTRDRSEPVRVRAEGLSFTSIHAGGGHTCALADDGSAWCWGFNQNGQLGAGAGPNRSEPQPVSGGLTFTTIAASQSLHSCGIATGGAAYCWGWNAFGQLGIEDTGDQLTPVAVSGGLEFASISTGNFHTCALTTGGEAYCWGENDRGQLGDGTTADRTSPVRAGGDLTFRTISAGFEHTCGVTVSGEGRCWGLGDAGQLGNGATSSTPETTPVTVSGNLSFLRIDAGALFTCGITAQNAAYCWGFNNGGQLGAVTAETCFRPDSQMEVSCARAPLAVSGGLQFSSLSAGNQHTCGVTTDQVAYCWGRSTNGQLGTGKAGNDVILTEPARVNGQT